MRRSSRSGSSWAIQDPEVFITGIDGNGRLTGNDAIKFFAMSKLSRPELKRVAAVGPIGREPFEREQVNLLSNLKNCPRRLVIAIQLKKEMPAIIGKSSTQRKLIDNLEDEFAKVQRGFHLPAGDFPNVEHFKEVLSGHDIDKFEKLKPYRLWMTCWDMISHNS